MNPRAGGSETSAPASTPVRRGVRPTLFGGPSSSLRANFRSLFTSIVVLAGCALAWALYDQWRNTVEHHEIRQRSQITTVASATQTVMASQEVVLDLLGRQLLLDGLVDDPEAATQLLDQALRISPVVAGYGLASVDGSLLIFNSTFDQDALPNLLEQAATRDSFLDALASDGMVIGRPYRMPALDDWVIPVRKAIRDSSGAIRGVMTAGLQLYGPDPFFEEQSFLGERNTVQVVREADLFPLHWAAPVSPPADYYQRAIPRGYYEQAVASAEERSGLSLAEIMASGVPVSYRNVNAAGPQYGMAVHDPRYGYWVLTQTHRNQLLADFARAAWVYVAIFALVLLLILAMLRVVGRAERRRQRELIRRANHDTLTGLPNRQRMIRDFSVMQRRHRNALSLLFIDMDNFKSINDGFGHVQGDALLQQLGERLQASALPEESVARIGGDEFVLLTPEIEAESLLERANELIDRLAAHYTVKGVRCELGCSVGIATTTEAGESLSDMLRAADIAMYAAKKDRNSARFYEPAMGGRYLRNIHIEQNLKGAVDQGLVRTVYQPQVDARGRVVGFEALARWHDAELGWIEPRRFIAVAEASGYIRPLGDYILDRCLVDALAIEAHLDHPLRLAINVSVRQFRQSRFAERFIERVERSALKSTQVVVEITENLFMDDHGLVMEELEQLRTAGVRVSLDDFGTGFSSLGLLRSLPVDELKIDKSFIDNLAFDPAARNLVQSMVAIAKNHGMALVAEGVETDEQFEMLREDGCDVFQGFLFARPMGRDQVLDYLARPVPAER